MARIDDSTLGMAIVGGIALLLLIVGIVALLRRKRTARIASPE